MTVTISDNKENDNKKDRIVVLRQTSPGMCGGTDATQNIDAPKEICSSDMILFNVESAVNGYFERKAQGAGAYTSEPINFVSAFAAPAGNATFIFLVTSCRTGFCEKRTADWALIKEDIFPKLTELVREADLAKRNGFHSKTHGLPQNFGGSVNIQYKSGEKIDFSDNQSPIIRSETAEKIAAIFTEAMKGERVKLPAVAALKAIRYSDERENGGFTRAVLTLNPDGTGTNKKQSRYDDSHVFESESTVEKETIDAIKKNIKDTGILAWADLPDNNYKPYSIKTLIFEFEDGNVITVGDNKRVPGQIRDGFFNIDLEMTTKH